MDEWCSEEDLFGFKEPKTQKQNEMKTRSTKPTDTEKTRERFDALIKLLEDNNLLNESLVSDSKDTVENVLKEMQHEIGNLQLEREKNRRKNNFFYEGLVDDIKNDTTFRAEYKYFIPSRVLFTAWRDVTIEGFEEEWEPLTYYGDEVNFELQNPDYIVDHFWDVLAPIAKKIKMENLQPIRIGVHDDIIL